MKIKYPKFIIFAITVLLAYYFYQLSTYGPIHDSIINLGLAGAFIAGLLYTYGFTTAFAIALFLVIGQDSNILITGLVGGFGALLSDLLIFRFIRKSFSDEIVSLSHERIIMKIDSIFPKRLKRYLVPVLGGMVLASPLPDELAVAILATLKRMTTSMFIIISYISKTMGILIILGIGKLLG